jgi:hypothetical protein
MTGTDVFLLRHLIVITTQRKKAVESRFSNKNVKSFELTSNNELQVPKLRIR